MNIHVGTSGYSYPAWKGKFYPKDLRADQMLHYYAERFNTVEINNTFFRLPKLDVVKDWLAAAPADFTFVIKAPRAITHMRRLKNAESSLKSLLDFTAAFKRRLGPLLFQLPPNMKKDVGRLREFLSLLPARRRAAFEYRHQSWFDDDVFAALKEHDAAMCLAEADDELKTPFVATTSWGYLRLRRGDYSDGELRSWVKRVRKQDWRDVFVFFKHEDEATGPRFAQRFSELAHGKGRPRPRP
jgi:uncharacterized protein YecE (DUF72 family)